MKYKISISLLFFLIYNSIMWMLLFIFGNNNINIFSIVSLIFVLLMLFVVDDKNDYIIQNKNNNPHKIIHLILSYSDRYLNETKYKYYILAILVLNVLLAVANSYIIMNKIKTDGDINIENIIRIVKALNVTSIIITQFGGFCIQAILIYMLAVIFGSEKPLNAYLKIVGFSYIGFVVLTIISITINYFFVVNYKSLTDFNITYEKSIFYNWLGKSGESLVLILISLGIYNSDKFSLPKSFVIATLPTILLLLLKTIFSNLLQI